MPPSVPSSLRRLAALGLLLSACRAPAPAEFRVGLIGVFDGPARLSSGVPARLGAQLAVDELNAAGGVVIGGVAHRVVLVDKATPNRPDAAASVARELVNLDSVDVIVGPQFSHLAIAAGAVAEAAEVPMITPMASAAAVTEGRRFVTRLAFVDAVQGRVLARYAFDSLRVRRVAAMHNAASAYGRDIVTLFTREFERSGGTLTAVTTYDADDPASRRRAIAEFMRARPEAVLLPNFTGDDSLDLREMRERGFRGRLLGSDAWDAIALEKAGDVNAAILAANWDRRAERPEMEAFRASFTKRHADERPRATAAATYDAIRLLAAAATRAGATTGADLATALRTAGDVAGAFGRYRFTGTGDPVRGAAILEMVGDSSVLRALFDPDP